MASQNIIQTASVKLIVNGSVIGFATGIQWSRSKGVKEIREIDNPYVVEFMETAYSCSGSMTGLRLRTDMGNLEGNGIMPLQNMKKIFNVNYCTLHLVDRITGKDIANFTDVSFDNDSWSVNARGIITFNVSFKARFVASDIS